MHFPEEKQSGKENLQAESESKGLNSLSRRDFMGMSFTAAISLLFGKRMTEEARQNNEGCFELVDGNGSDVLTFRNGRQKLTLIYTNHDEAVDINKIPPDTRHLVLDTGGLDLNCNLGAKFKMPCYQPLEQLTLQKPITTHILPPAYPFGVEATQALDDAILILATGVGACMTGDAVLQARRARAGSHGEIIPDLHENFITGGKTASRDLTASGQVRRTNPWRALPAAAMGMLLAEPGVAAWLRLSEASVTHPTEFTENYLRNSLNRNPLALLLMNQLLDATLAAKLRELMDYLDHDKNGEVNVALLMGATHVQLREWMKVKKEELWTYLQHPFIQSLLRQYKGDGALSLVASRAYAQKQLDPNNPLKVETKMSQYVYPAILDLLSHEQQNELMKNQLAQFGSSEIVESGNSGQKRIASGNNLVHLLARR